MIEQRRIQYLSAIGIDSYIPRRVLAHAAPSSALVALDMTALAAEPEAKADRPELKIPANDTSDQFESSDANHLIEVSELTNKVAEPVAQVLSMDEGLNQAPVKASVDTFKDVSPVEEPIPIKPPTSSKTSDSSQTLRFVLSLWSISQKILVIDTRQVGSALPTDRLLQNILRAIGYPLAQLPPSELMRWPIFKNDPQANNEAEAMAMVQANINARCMQTSGLVLLVMGDAATRFILPAEADFESRVGEVQQHENWQATSVVLPSLVGLLEAPLKKVLVWQALQKVFACNDE